MIRVILQVRKQMRSMELEPVKGRDTSKSGTTLPDCSARCLSPRTRSQCPELGTKSVYTEQGRMRCLAGAIKYLHNKRKDTQEEPIKTSVTSVDLNAPPPSSLCSESELGWRWFYSLEISAPWKCYLGGGGGDTHLIIRPTSFKFCHASVLPAFS